MDEIVKAIARPEVAVFLIPIVAIAGYAINRGLKSNYKHKERMAKIENGIDPDR